MTQTGEGKRALWNQRYAASELVWGAEPNRFVEAVFRDVEPRGRALDLACGEGRNAIWLSERGWIATGVDYSAVAIERASERAKQRGATVEFVEADVTAYAPDAGAYDLVVVAYLQVPPADRQRAWAHAAAALSPTGELFAIGHALENLEKGTGGPQSPDVLWDPRGLADELRACGLDVETSEHVLRPVEGSEVDAIDTLLRARRRS